MYGTLKQEGVRHESVRHDHLKQAVALIKQAVEGLDPEVLDPSFAADLVKTFAEGERVCSAGKALAARRVDSSGTWRKSGEPSAAHWMARQTGEPLGSAIASIKTAKQVAELPETEKALRSGKLSSSQASQIASAASAAPVFESDLLEAAKTENFSGLKQQCEKIKAAAAGDEAARHNAIQRSRRLRHWTDPMGAFRLEASLTPEAGGTLLAALKPLQEEISRQAKKQGRNEAWDAYAADALVQMAKQAGSSEGVSSGSGPKALVHVRVDHSALVRGHTEPGETCEIAGVGPISVAAARALASDAFLAAIVTDGVDIKSISHLGRSIPARLRTAITARDPVCVVPGCNNARFLEIDHITPVEERGPTCLENLARLCSHHHDQKTYRGYKLAGGPGSWVWKPPKPPPEG